MRVEQLIQHLEAAKSDFAKEMLERPLGREPFDYGRAVGVYSGLDMAKQIILDLYRDVEERDRLL